MGVGRPVGLDTLVPRDSTGEYRARLRLNATRGRPVRGDAALAQRELTARIRRRSTHAGAGNARLSLLGQRARQGTPTAMRRPTAPQSRGGDEP